MADYVPEGSFLYCDKGVIPTPFRITEFSEVSLADVRIASDENNKGIINVIPFGICAVKGGQPCLPATNSSSWINMSADVCVGPGEALLDKSQLPCTQGGMVKIAPSFLHALTEMYSDPGEMFDKMVDMLKGTGENALAMGKGLLKGAWGLLGFAWDVVKFPFAEGYTALTDFDQFKDNWGSRYDSTVDFGQAALEKGQQLYGLATDPEARAAMWTYMSNPDTWESAFDGVYSAVSEMDNAEIAEFGGQMAFEVLLGVFTGGMGAARHVNKADDVYRAARALENLDDFGDAGRMLDNALPDELIGRIDDIDDVPGGQTVLGQADEAGGGRKINPEGGDMNCAGCSIAGDATLKGNPASAIVHGVTSTDDVLRQFGQTAWSTGNTQANIVDTMGGLGDGATGVIFGHRGAGKVGHFFNVTNKNGTIQFLDFQKSGSAVMNSSEFNSFQDLWFIDTGG